jgi:hypothetical protein
VARKAGAKSLKSGSAGNPVVSARILLFCCCRSARLATARSRSRPSATRLRASSRKWTDDHSNCEDQQHPVDRHFVDLDPESAHHYVLAELVPVQPGVADVEREPGRVQDELVVAPRLVPPVDLATNAGLCGGLPVVLGDEIGLLQDREPPADQPVRRDPLAERERSPRSTNEHLRKAPS